MVPYQMLNGLLEHSALVKNASNGFVSVVVLPAQPFQRHDAFGYSGQSWRDRQSKPSDIHSTLGRQVGDVEHTTRTLGVTSANCC